MPDLRFAYNTNGVANHRFEDALSLIADSGYHGVALTLDHHHFDPFAPHLAQRADALAAQLDRLHLGLVIETGARYLLDPRRKHEPTMVSPEPEGRKLRVEFLARAVQVAEACNGEAVSFWAGVPRPDVTAQAAAQYLRECLESLLERVGQTGVSLALEPEPGMLVETVDDYRTWKKQFPRLTLALDTGHCLVSGDRDPAAAVRELAPDLGTVTVEDMRRGIHDHLPFGQGDMNIGEVLRALRDIVFKKLVCVELSRDSHRAHTMVPEALAYLKKRMRICFFSRRYFPAISGMSVYAQNLLRQLVRAGDDVTMISQYRGDETGSRIYGGGPPPAVPGVTVIGLEAAGEQNGGDFEADVEQMVSVAVQEHHRKPFDLLHAQYCYPTGLAALEASRRLNLPNVVSVQGGDGHWVGLCCPTHKAAMLAVLGHAGALLIGSRSFAEEVHHNHGTPLGRFTIVPGAVDTERFTPGEAHEPPVLLYHGRVDRRKGVLDLLDAMALLAQKPQLIISGIGPDTAAVASRIAELGLTGTVKQSGYVAYGDVPAIYHRGDIFLSPTYAEGFSNTILEAMASGLPVISCRSVGVVDCLRDGENGLLVEPGNVPALAGAIERLMGDPGLRAALRSRALDEVRHLYSWPQVAGQIRSIYQSLLGTKPDVSWTVPTGRAPCRFRLEPHLL